MVTRGEFLIPLSFVIAGIILFCMATRMVPLGVVRYPVGPGAFPMAVTGLMVIVGLALVYRAVKLGEPETETKEVHDAPTSIGAVRSEQDAPELVHITETGIEEVVNPRNLWITIGAMVGYALLVEILGFVVLTPVWLAAYMFAIGMRRWGWLAGTAVIFSAFVIIGFGRLMMLVLPRGVGIFREISYLFH